MTGFWASYLNLLFNHGLPAGFFLWKTIWRTCCIYFSNLLQLFCESPSRSPWYLNSDWNINGLAPKWRTSGLPIQIYCFTLGFQRASLCGRPFEARVVFIIQNYSNSFVKAHVEARGIKALKKQKAWPQNDELLGFLFKSFVESWASNVLLFVEDHLEPVLCLFFNHTATLLWKPVQKPMVLKLWRNKYLGLKMTGFWASYSNPLFNHGLPTGFSLWKTIWSPFVLPLKWYCSLREMFSGNSLRSQAVKLKLEHFFWLRFWICNYFCEIFKFLDFMDTLTNFVKFFFARLFVKFKYLTKNTYINGISISSALKWYLICSYF